MTRISVPMTHEEYIALTEIAADNCRSPREQLRYLLREDLKRRGLLSEKDKPENKLSLKKLNDCQIE